MFFLTHHHPQSSNETITLALIQTNVDKLIMSVVPQAASASPMPDGVTDPNYQPPPGRLGNLTVMQLHILEKFKKELKEEGHFVEERMDDAMLLRCRFSLLFEMFG